MATNQRKPEQIVEELEDPLNSYLLRCNNYKELCKILETSANVDVDLIEKVLAVCTRDIKDDMRYSASALSLIAKILEKFKVLAIVSSSHLPSLIPSALAVIHILKLGANVDLDALLVLSIECMKKYPEFVITSLVVNHSKDIYEVLEPQISLKNVNRHAALKFMEVLPFKLMEIILKVLPDKPKEDFIKNGYKVWFTGIVPKLFALTLITDDDIEVCIEAVEVLTECLTPYDYADNPYWTNLMEKCICKEEKFPVIIKRLLETDKKYWCRLWIILIKLLKNQITQSTNTSKSPINSLLPVVEQGFKMKPEIRYQAFLCWDALVDNFSSNIVESQFNKRIKLLIIPLKSSNAKVEQTTLAKFNTWWNLIRRYYCKMDKLVDMVLNPFLHFCFGKYLNGKIIPSPGKMNDEIRKLCLQALVEIAGHFQCEGCCQIPKLQGRLLSAKLLAETWNDWLHYLKSAVHVAINDDSVAVVQQMTCLWNSLVGTVAEMPENSKKQDLLNELLDVPIVLLKEKQHCVAVSEKLFNVCILSLFDDDKFYSLFKTKKDEQGPLHKILFVIEQPWLMEYFQSKEMKELLIKLKPLARFVLNTTYNFPDDILDKMCRELYPRVTSMVLWTAFADAIRESNYKLGENTLRSFILWPIKFLHLLPDEVTSEAWKHWVTLYNIAAPNVKLNTDIKELLLTNYKFMDSSTQFALCASLILLKYHFPEHVIAKDLVRVDITKEINLTREIIKKCKQNDIIKVSSLINDTLSLLLNSVSTSSIIGPGLLMLSDILELYISTLKCRSNDQSKLDHLVENLLKKLDAALTPQTPTTYLSPIIDKLIENLSLLDKNTSLVKKIKDICEKCFLHKYKFNDMLINKIKKEVLPSVVNKEDNNISLETNVKTKSKKITTLESNTPDSENLKETIHEKQTKELQVENNFTTPSSKSLSRKSNKKEPNIVNTVVENGEEFVVVKSNWKFNPRKLTENQKEKFKRKREDIPALYQDLSQSQDEFTLTTWKTDSQDTTNSTSSSKSNVKPTNQDVTSILTKIPGNDVVPSIIENIALDKSKRDVEYTNPAISELSRPRSPSVKTLKRKIKDSSESTEKKSKVQAIGETKSPRMALKDRVFRNVRNLIEKSNVSSEKNVQADEKCQNTSEKVLKTPLTKTSSTANLINSAPPKLSSERPSRVIKKPKKFDDSELLVIKKRRRSNNDSQSDRELPEISFTSPTVDIKGINTLKDDKPVNEKVNNNIAISKSVTLEIENVKTGHTTEAIEGCTKKDIVPKKKVMISSTDDTKIGMTHKIKDVSVILTDFVDQYGSQIEKAIDNSKLTNDLHDNSMPKKNVVDSHEPNTPFQRNDSKSITNVDVRKKEYDVSKTTDVNKSNLQPTNNDNSTPKPKSKNNEGENISVKKKTSRIEKQLSIDMVEGHPFLQSPVEKRASRKTISNSTSERRRKKTERIETPNKSKTDSKGVNKTIKEKTKHEKSQSISISDSDSIKESQDIPLSEDVIESSQDSTVTAISVASTKQILNKKNITEPSQEVSDSVEFVESTQELLACVDSNFVNLNDISKRSSDCNEDIELSKNKTMLEQNELCSTENMDTEPIEDEGISGEVEIVKVIVTNTEEVGIESQQIAEADTQPIVIENFAPVTDELNNDLNASNDSTIKNSLIIVKENMEDSVITIDSSTQDDKNTPCSENLVTPTLTLTDSTGACSPLKDDIQKKNDFLNNTIEISPIKTMSPIREKKSPSPDSSGDYVIIKLSSPVQSNGEPFEKENSPEVFTEEKISPEKFDQSPPRTETIPTSNSSPSSSLSLKKNRPQVRAGGRGAQMLGLCAQEKLKEILNSERSNDSEDCKKTNTLSTPARRNLRILYNTVVDNNENPDESENSENFLKFKRAVPTPDCSPAGPILKRKMAEIADDTSSPASKRKRVSFHDPPVSTTIAVQKYIEPGGVRSPQNSALKRLERQIKCNAGMKSPKRLDTVFKLETVLTKTIESFNDEQTPTSGDTVMSSIEQTPVVEVIKTSDLNDTDPICKELLNCKDPIEKIASELSSPGMRDLFVKELKGKVDTIADLAKMTELEVNRLCIKVPKIQTAKKVLSDYALRRENDAAKLTETNSHISITPQPKQPKTINVESSTQTNDVITKDIEMQTKEIHLTVNSTQTEILISTETSCQTDESGLMPTKNIIEKCLAERPDFIDALSEQLPESSVTQLANRLSATTILEILMKKMTTSNSPDILNRLVAHHSAHNSPRNSENKEISFLQGFSKDLILLCSRLIQNMHDEPA